MSSPFKKKSSDEAYIRNIALPASLLDKTPDTIIGDPNLEWLRTVHFVIGTLFLIIGTPFLAFNFLQKNDFQLLSFLLGNLLACLLIGTALIIFRHARKLPHHEMWINSLHFGYKTPFSLISDPASEENEISWSDIIHAPDGLYDVTVAFSSRKSIAFDLIFWYKDPDGNPHQLSVPLRRLSPRTFKNGMALKKSLLLRLASHRPSLRFDPNVFVQTRIDPDSWNEMNKPFLFNGLMIITLSTIMIFFACAMDIHQSMIPPFLSWLSITLVITMAFFFIWNKLFPKLRNTIRFQKEND